MGKKPPNKKAPAPLIEALEPRILFSADAFGAALDIDPANDPLADALEQARLEYDRTLAETQKAEAQKADALKTAQQKQHDEQATALSTNHQDPVLIQGNANLAPATTHELVLVDTDTPDYQTLVDDLLQHSGDRQFEIVLLDNTIDGIEQVTAILANYNGLDALHVISHGEDGAIDLGASRLDQKTLDVSSVAIAQWSSAFGVNGDLLIYGCNLAATANGENLVTALGQLTGADVAASDDITGHRSFGGDWDFEYTVGQVETEIAFSSDAQAAWNGLLSTVNVTQTIDVVNGNVTSVADLIANDGGDGISLREAILATNADTGVADTINIAAGTYTLAIGGTLEDLAATGDLDITDDLTILGTGIGTTIIEGNTIDRVFDVLSGTVTISDLTVQGGDTTIDGGDGAGLQVGAAANVTVTNALFTGNSAGKGGAFQINSGGILAIVNSTLDNNDAQSKGGAIHNQGGDITLTGVTVSNNSSLGQSGAIHSTNASAVNTIT
ncbi:MAG: DUF4347 domain-containing protein, partial [Gammaproteobacteria bacterium]|nr:DUF4347 domain-containing protein [Gammaproteobacteria bacterium]